MSVTETPQKQKLHDVIEPNTVESKDESHVFNEVDSEEKQLEEKVDTCSIDKQLEDLSIDEKNETKGPQKLSREEKYAIQVEADARSIFVGNITPDVTPEIIEEHFAECGEIKRITLLHDKHTGVPKGYAYVQFECLEIQEKALELNGSELKGNKINVYKKRTNLPGYHKFVQYQRPNFYYPNQWAYIYNGVPSFKGMDFFQPYSFHPDQQRNFGRFNYSNRGTYRNNYRGDKRGGNSSRGFHKNNNNFYQNGQIEENDQHQGLEYSENPPVNSASLSETQAVKESLNQ